MKNEYKIIQDDIKEIWTGIKSGKYKYKRDVYERLFIINKNINTIDNRLKENYLQKKVNSIFFKDKLLFNLSQSTLLLYELMSAAIFDDLITLKMILNYGVDKDVYFIFNKEAVKVWATKLDWFFVLYNKAEIVEESDTYILLKDTLSSNLCFTANIVLDTNKEMLLNKYENEPTALNFYKEITKK